MVKFANSIDLDEVAHNEPPHLDLHYLPSRKFCHLLFGSERVTGNFSLLRDPGMGTVLKIICCLRRNKSFY